MHDDELRNTVNQLGQALVKFTNETNATFKQLTAKVEETSAKVKETSAKVGEMTTNINQLIADSKAAKIRQAQDDAKFNELLRKVDKVAKLSNNTGTVAETFFVKALERDKELMGLKFHAVRRNVGTVKEFDIVMVNDDVVVVISVKHILHVRDVKKFAEEDLKKVPLLFPEFRSYKLYGGVAGMHINGDARLLAGSSGLIVLGQAGQNVAVLNERGFEPRVMNN